MAHREPIAIIGMSCRFPGAPTLRDLWRLLLSGRDAITEVPRDRWDSRRMYQRGAVTRGKAPSQVGGFIDAVHFDFRFFGLSPLEVEQMDPQQLLMLELTWQALEDAHVPHTSLAGGDTSVFVGSSVVSAMPLFGDPGSVSVHSLLGLALSSVSNRVSSFFNLRGESVVVDSACASSLSAMHAAIRSLRAGETHLAIVGGVNVWLLPQIYLALAQLGVMSPTGLCRPFDTRGDGIVAADGAGVVILKPLATAQKDGDRIYAVVHGSAVNQDGHAEGMGRPALKAKVRLIRAALDDAEVAPSDVAFIEAHGTGTPIGDSVEARAIARALGASVSDPTLIGSIKGHIGHAQAAAGIASLIKTALALHHRVVPPTLHHERGDPDLATLGLVVPTVETPWPRRAHAGVSAFGVGGSNAHVVLGPAPVATPRQAEASDAPFVLLASARDQAALTRLKRAYSEQIAVTPDLRAFCDEAAAARGELSERHVAIGSSLAELQTALDTPDASRLQGVGAARVAFVFTGHGPNWSRLPSAIPKSAPSFWQTLARAEAFVRAEAGFGFDDLKRTATLQPAICAFQIALVDLWRAVGVEPSFVIGHSVGEVAAAYTAGVLEFEDALRLAIRRGAILEALHGQGTLIAAQLAPDEAAEVVAASPGCWIAAYNGPKQTVIGVPASATRDLELRLVDAQIAFLRVGVDYPFHGPLVAPLMAALQGAGVPVADPKLVWISTVTGEVIERAPPPRYWAREASEPVRLDAAITKAAERGAEVFFELSPANVLSRPISSRARLHRATAVAMLHGARRHDFWQGAAELWLNRGLLQWTKLLAPQRSAWLELPPYPFAREQAWTMPPADRSVHWSGRMRLEQAPAYFEAWHPAPSPASIPASPKMQGVPSKLAAAVRARCGEDKASALLVWIDVVREDHVAKIVASLPALRRHRRVVFVYSNRAPVEARAGLVAFLRSLRVEHKTLGATIIEIDAKRSVNDQAAVITRALGSGETVWRQRGKAVEVPRLERAPTGLVTPLALSPDATYVITGGLGGIGLRLADHLAERGARHLLLLSRRRLPPRARWAKPPKAHRRTIEALLAIERRGVHVRVASVDVGSAKAVAACFAAHAAAQFPPVRGVIHAAGELERLQLARLRPQQIARQWRTKVDGLRHLERACPDVDFLVCLSSLGAAFGIARAASYSRANAGMDAVIAAYRKAGKPYSSVRLGPVADVGMIVDARAGAVMAALGQELLTIEHVCAAIDRVCVSPEPVLLVAQGDWATLAAFVVDRPYFDRLIEKTTITFAAPQTEAERVLVRLWSRLLRLDELSIHDNVFERGATSLTVQRFVAAAHGEGWRFVSQEIWTKATVAEQAKLVTNVPVTSRA